jgi:hypothetical protein
MFLSINLIEESDGSEIAVPRILAVIKDRGMRSDWRIEKNAEACGDAICERIHEYSDSGKIFLGEELYFLVSHRIQIIEGKLSAFDKNMKTPWIVIRVQDGSCIDVVSSDESIYEKIRQFYTLATYCFARDLIGDDGSAGISD